jgi:hypothetical protein
MDKEHNKLVNKLLDELESDNLAIFVGAGMSRAAGFVDWKSLLKPIADDLDLDIEKEIDLVALAQYHANANRANRNRLNQLLVDQFSKDATPTENHEILARLPISTYWTTNYDRLIERALKDAGKVVDAKYLPTQMTLTVRNRDAVVYKMHGDVEHADQAVLTRDDYEAYHKKMKPFLNALTGDLASKTFLFLGFSFTDPNLDYILSRVRIAYGQNQRQSYCVVRHVSQDKGESQADYEYRQRKQELFQQELLRFAIRVVYVDDFSQITEILQALDIRYRKRSVFISGAAHDYAPYTQKDSEKFVFDLAKEISRKNFRVFSGFGLGIGSAVISGVVEATALSGKGLDEDRLIVRPFPQVQPGSVPISDLWQRYRDDIIRRAGVAIFIFGNKIKDGKVVCSNGMRNEFDLAVKYGLLIIPVGITGYISEELWQETVRLIGEGKIKVSNEIAGLIGELGDKKTTLDRAREIVLEILEKK